MFRAPPLPRTFAAAMRDLGAEKPSDRAAAVRDLVPHAEASRVDVVAAIQKALKADPAPEVRSVAATSLSDLGAKEAVPALLAAVDDANTLVRQMAIAALGELGDEAATPRIERALTDELAEVRFQAVMAFPRVSPSREKALEALLRATRDDDALVCHIALRMTEELRDPREGGELDARVVVRARALLAHDSSQVRIIAAVLLAETPGALEGPNERARDRAYAILAKAAAGQEKTTDPEDAAAAIELTGELGIEAARAGLERRAFGGILGFRRDPLAWHARVALARMGHERASREILGELGDRDRDVRTLAVAAAGRAHLVAARDRILAMRGDAKRADPHAVDEALLALDGDGSRPMITATA